MKAADITYADNYVQINSDRYYFGNDATGSPSGWRWVFIADVILWAASNNIKFSLNGKA